MNVFDFSTISPENLTFLPGVSAFNESYLYFKIPFYDDRPDPLIDKLQDSLSDLWGIRVDCYRFFKNEWLV